MTNTRELPPFVPEDILLESFTFPFFDFNFNVDPVSMVGLFHQVADPTPKKGYRGLYIHIPFCDTLCSFCPFIKAVGSQERIVRYLQALEIELELFSSTNLCRSWTFDAIYIGGGTPSVLSEDQIARLITKIRASVDCSPKLELTIEVEPKSATGDFCSAAASAGANRVSFGIQTFNPEFREMMNLTASLEQVEDLARRSRRDFAVANFDMIVGYPGQTAADVETDMAAALRLDVGNVSVFPLDYLTAMPSLLDRIRSGKLPPPPPSRKRWDLFHQARAELGRGYAPQNMYFFTEPGMPGCRYMFDIVYGGYFDEFVGLGVGAYSMLRGLSYCNTLSEEEYATRLIEHRTLPVFRTTPGQAYEKSYVYFGKRTTTNMREARELGIDSFIQPKFDALLRAGLVEQQDDSYKLTYAGERIYAQIMVGFLSDNQRRLYDRVCSRMKNSLNWEFDGAGSAERASARGLAAKNTMGAAKIRRV